MTTHPTLLTPEQTQSYLANRFVLSETTLAIEVARACNLRCPGCWVRISRKDVWARPTHGLMSDTLIDQALAFGRNANIHNVSLLGGEPTLHPDLPTIIQRARRRGYEKTSVTTNGILPRPRLRSILHSGLTNITFSVDGSSRLSHDRLRPSQNGRSTFHTLLASLALAVQESERSGCGVTVNTTVYPDNIDDIKSICKMVAGMGVRRIRLHFSVPGDKDIERYGYITPERWIRLVREAGDLSRSLQCEIQVPRVYGGQAVQRCVASRSPYLTVQPDGTLLACAAYARLADPHRRRFGVLVDEKRIGLFDRCQPETEEVANGCCGAVPLLVAGLPPTIQ